jgi:pimeloyl-ACP methyl ester carboxylesterase
MWPARDPSLRTRYVTLATGSKIRVVEGGNPNGSPVLLVHGWGACAYSYDAMAPALAQAGYRVLAIELPGFGLSDKPASPEVYTTRAMALALLDAATRLGVERFSLVGHSMGGAIGLRLATQEEPRLEKLVLVNSVGLGRAPLMAPLRHVTPEFLEPFIVAAVRRIVVRLILNLAYGTRGRPTHRDVDEYWAPTQFPEMLRACRLLVHHFDFDQLSEGALRMIRVPVLAIGSTRDRMVLGCSERAELIPGATRVAVNEGGHLALQECAERVNAAILDFLGNT